MSLTKRIEILKNLNHELKNDYREIEFFLTKLVKNYQGTSSFIYLREVVDGPVYAYLDLYNSKSIEKYNIIALRVRNNKLELYIASQTLSVQLVKQDIIDSFPSSWVCITDDPIQYELTLKSILSLFV